MRSDSERYYTRQRLPEPLRMEEGLEMVMERMKDVNDNPRRRAVMLAREKLERDNRSYFNDEIRQMEERVWAEADQKLRAEKAEAERKLREMARTLRDRGVDAAEICEITGWSEEELERL